MKKVCFLNLEGVLLEEKNYVVSTNKVNSFLKELTLFSKENNIELFLVTGYNELIAKQKFLEKGFNNFFDVEHFVFVSEDYISNKTKEDKEIHLTKLEEDPMFIDSFFKQVFIKNYLEKNSLNPIDALLLCNDIWVDGYYTNRFSGIDFALLKNNLVDRGNETQIISGLAYFELEFGFVKKLLIDFPKTDYSFLDAYVFEIMKRALVSDSVKESIKESILKKSRESKENELGSGGE